MKNFWLDRKKAQRPRKITIGFYMSSEERAKYVSHGCIDELRRLLEETCCNLWLFRFRDLLTIIAFS